jgi:hypothetical protein
MSDRKHDPIVYKSWKIRYVRAQCVTTICCPGGVGMCRQCPVLMRLGFWGGLEQVTTCPAGFPKWKACRDAEPHP